MIKIDKKLREHYPSNIVTCYHNTMSKFKIWFKRIGIIGILSFFIKGLVWVAIFFGVGSLFVK